MISFGDIETIDTIVYLVTCVFSYGVIATLAGTFRAWLAYRFGDDTAQELGFLDLDPIQHVDIFGFLCFILSSMMTGLSFGWARYVPVDIDNIEGKHAKAKRLIASFGDTIGYILIAIGMVLVFLIMFGYPLLNFALTAMRYGAVPHQYTLTQLAPSISSLKLTLLFVYVMFIYVCVLFGGISCVINFFHLIMTQIFEQLETHEIGFNFLLLRFVLLFFLFTFMLGPIHYAVMAIISYSSKFFAYCLGVLT